MLSNLPRSSDPRLLVGTNTADDAGVFLARPDLALVQTVDLLTPVVPDPYAFGQIAAANSLSDVYAMGGEPLTVMNVIGYPAAGRKDWLVEILRGALEKCDEAGAVVVGGHTFNDPEIKFGLAVTGLIDPKHIVTNDRARAGDQLILTKPLGSGTLSQALMTIDDVSSTLLSQGTEAMRTLNRGASQAMVKAGVAAATDITGFGMIGHLQEMVKASGVAARLIAAQIPVLPGVLELVESGVLNPGITMNEASFGRFVTVKSEECRVKNAQSGTSDDSPLITRHSSLLNVLYESQTSGGLLIAVEPKRVPDLQSRLSAGQVSYWLVGEIVDGPAGTITVEF